MLRPQHRPDELPRQTSRSVEPLRSFSKLQEEKPMDISQRIQRQSVVSENVLSQKHYDTALHNEMKSCILMMLIHILILLTDGTAGVLVILAAEKLVSRCRRTLRGEGHSAAGWGMGGSVIAAECGVQSPFIWAMGCRYLCCAT